MPIEFAPMISARDQLLDSFRDPEYRAVFTEERVRSSVALQIRALREQRQLTQKQLGDLLGMAQTWVSKLENPDYGKMAVATLLRLAKAFDTDLEIKFRPFSATIRDLPKQGPTYFAVPSFDDEFGVDDLSTAEIVSVISKSRLIVSAPDQSLRALASGAAAAQMAALVEETPRMPPGIASASTIEGRLYGSC